ncbi:MAG TPA: hypothetical protein VF026_01305 [Ktedonobacteraceae bacterium]
MLCKHRIPAEQEAQALLILIVSYDELPLLLVWSQCCKKALNNRVAEIILACTGKLRR